MNKQHFKEIKHAREEELIYAHGQNDSGHVWKIAKAMAGKAVRSNTGNIKMTAKEWSRGLTRQACEGGAAATHIQDIQEWYRESENQLLIQNNFQPNENKQSIPPIDTENIAVVEPSNKQQIPSRDVHYKASQPLSKLAPTFIPASEKWLHHINDPSLIVQYNVGLQDADSFFQINSKVPVFFPKGWYDSDETIFPIKDEMSGTKKPKSTHTNQDPSAAYVTSQPIESTSNHSHISANQQIQQTCPYKERPITHDFPGE